MSNKQDAMLLSSFVTNPYLQVATRFTNMYPPFNLTDDALGENSCDLRVMVGNSIQEGTAGKKGNLYLLI